MNVYLEFETPFYRLQVGDFTTKADAEKHVKILKDKGFKESLWVITKINRP
ncbi:SPOR domain-containing protein [Candidatus Latescibacterota bacterium]